LGAFHYQSKIETMKKDEIEQLIQEVIKGLPPFVGAVRKEVEQGLQLGLEALLKKMNLVSREEYDAQVALLNRLREQMDIMEQRLAEAEKIAQRNKPQKDRREDNRRDDNRDE